MPRAYYSQTRKLQQVMKIYNFSKSEPLPDYVNENDVLGQVKSMRTSIIKRFRFKPLNTPDLKVTYAGLGIRTWAALIDLALIAGLMFIPEVIFFSFNFNNTDYNIIRFLLVASIWIFYHTAFDSSASQATLGKRMLKLKITDLYGNRISITRSLFRSLTVSISIAAIGLGIWYISTDTKKRSWHDLITGTFVIKSNF